MTLLTILPMAEALLPLAWLTPSVLILVFVVCLGLLEMRVPMALATRVPPFRTSPLV